MMQPLKNFLLIILILVLVTAGLYVAYQRQVFAAIPQVHRALGIAFGSRAKSDTNDQATVLGIAPLNELDQEKLTTAFNDASSQLKILTARGQETGEMSSQVLGEFIQVNEEDSEKSTSEKALEYGRYLYCQQVVKEWEEVTASPE